MIRGLLQIILLLWGILLIVLPAELALSRQEPSTARLVVHSEFWHGDSDLYLRVPGSTHNTNITHTTGVETHPTWSPDGQWMAFVSDRDTEPGKKFVNAVYVMRRNGSGLRKIGLSSPATGTRVISWSPSGDWLYLKYITQGWWDSNFIRFSDAHTATLRFDTTFTSYAAWSPTADRLAYRTGMFGDPQTSLGIAVPATEQDVAGTHIILQLNEYIDFVTWSLDGQSIAFTTQEYGQATAPSPSLPVSASTFSAVPREGGRFHLYRVQADGTGLEHLFSATEPFYKVAWSPTNSITFSTWATDSIFQVDAENTVERLTTESGVYPYFAWSSDGEQLAFFQKTGDVSHLFLLQNRHLRKLYTSSSDIFRVVWTEDDQRIFFVEGEREQGHLYWIYPDGSGLQYLTDTAFTWDIPVSPIIDSKWHGGALMTGGVILLVVLGLSFFIDGLRNMSYVVWQ